MKKTTTLVNYFILNTTQFLNSFSQVMENNLENVDKKLDDIETTIAIFEQKLSSIPEKVFENLPVAQQQTQVLAPT